MSPSLSRLALLMATLSLAVACGPASDVTEQTGSEDDALVLETGVDYSWARPSPTKLKAEGYTFAARYLSHTTTGKNLTLSEANALWAAGVDVVVVWEQSATTALGGFAQGASDAKAAEAQAAANGMPKGRPIYSAVDFDAQPSQQSVINAYFDGVASVIGVSRTGAYGGYYLIQRLFNAKKIAWGWQTYAWSYGNWDSRAQVRQVKNGITAGGSTSCCDKDEAVAVDFGQWHAKPPNTPPRGYLDGAACDAISGWAQDEDAPSTAIDVDFFFDGLATTKGAPHMSVVAGNKRNDLCKAIGSCNHGFSFEAPVGLADGKPHTVHAYGADTKNGPRTLLTGSPKTFTCANAKPPLDVPHGVKRHVVDAASMTAWSFSALTDVAPEPQALIDSYPQAADWSTKPALVQADDGTPEVWLIDGDLRRHVLSEASLAAWHQTVAEVVKTPAAKVYAHPQGADLPLHPFLMKGDGAAVWVLDVAPSTMPLPVTPPPAGGSPNGNGNAGGDANADGAHAGGCSVHGAAPSSSWLALLPMLALLRRRRAR